MFEDLITDRTLEDVQNRTAKGHYNATDLNRVEHAAKQISELLTKEAYPVVYQPHKRLVSTEEWDKNTLLLLHCENFQDDSFYSNVIQNNGVEVSENQRKFGTKSFHFNGGQTLQINVPVSEKMTLEFWLYADNLSVSQYPTPVSYEVDGYRGIYMHTLTNATYYGITKNGGELYSDMGDVIRGNKWTHIAITRDNFVTKFFVDGKIKKEMADSIPSNDILVLGATQDSQNLTYFSGYIDEIRISNTIRYTSDFIPPTEQFTAKIHVTEYTEADWVEPESYYGIPDHPTESEMERYLCNLSELKRQFCQKKDTPQLPITMSRLTHTAANNIEQFVKDTGSAYESMQMIKRKSGTFKVGELLP